AIVSQEGQKVNTCCSILAGVQSHDVRRHECRRIRSLWALERKSCPDSVVEILRYPKCSLPRPSEANDVLAILPARPQFRQACNPLLVCSQKRPHLTGSDSPS